MKKSLFVMLALSVMVGCGKEARLIGSWKAKPVEQKSGTFQDAAQSSMMGFAAQNLRIEFTKDKKFKMWQPIGQITGSFEIQEDKINLTFDTFAPFRNLSLRFGEGGTLETASEFSSDPKIVFVKE